MKKAKVKKIAEKLIDKSFADFRYNYSVEELNRIDDGQGGTADNWIAVATIDAIKINSSGKESEKGGRIQDSQIVKFYTVYNGALKVDQRLTNGSDIFTIIDLNDVATANGMMILTCEIDH